MASSVTQDEFYAGLWYTVIYGLVFSSVITLIAVPVLYYSVFRNKEEWELSRRKKLWNWIVLKSNHLKDKLLQKDN